MKIAVITDDGKAISQHLGRDPTIWSLQWKTTKSSTVNCAMGWGALNSGMKITSIKKIPLAGIVTDLRQRAIMLTRPERSLTARC